MNRRKSSAMPGSLALQVGAVAILFAAALASLWRTASEALERERRRETARQVLDQAGAELARATAPDLAEVPDFPYTLDPEEWAALDQRLSRLAASVLERFEGVEGGFYVLSSVNRYLGQAFPTEKPGRRPPTGPTAPARLSQPPSHEFPVIRSQVETALVKNQPTYVVVDVPPSTVAVRTAPVWVEGRKVGVTWTMIRLVDPLFLDRSIRGYRLAAALALCGIALALVLTIGLVWTIRRQLVAYGELQAELRRSERLAALGKLLAGVAHEVRNPLAGIRSTAQLWQRGIGPDAESMTDLQAEVDRLDSIVSLLLQFSRADGQSYAPGDLNAVVAEAARLVRPQAEGQGVGIETHLDPSLPELAMAAPALLQVLRNLTSNALQAMPEGGVLGLTTRYEPAGRALCVAVTDTGPGLAAKAVAHLFEPFFTTKPGGTGLGLAIAHEIALAHRGELRGANRTDVPHGAVFTLVLPEHDAPRS